MGFQALGDNKIGGMFYVRIILALSFLLISFTVSLTEIDWRKLLIATFLISLLPFLSDIAYLFSGGLFDFTAIFQGATTIQKNLDFAEEGSSFFRIQSGAVAATSLVFAGLLITQRDTKALEIKKSLIIILGIALICAGISGHRLAFIEMIFILLLYYFIDYRTKIKTSFVVKSVAILVVILIFLYVYRNAIPPVFQRMFSFLPFFSNDNQSIIDAEGSTQFRLILWGIAVTQIPQYWLIGKGLAATPMFDITNRGGYNDALSWFAEMGAFHNGPLGLLINFGIAGLLLGFALFFYYSRIFLLTLHQLIKTKHYPIYKVILVNSFITTFMFVFLYGDMQSNFPDVVFLLGIIVIYLNSIEHNRFTNSSST
jgi:hypothetical protein